MTAKASASITLRKIKDGVGVADITSSTRYAIVETNTSKVAWESMSTSMPSHKGNGGKYVYMVTKTTYTYTNGTSKTLTEETWTIIPKDAAMTRFNLLYDTNYRLLKYLWNEYKDGDVGTKQRWETSTIDVAKATYNMSGYSCLGQPSIFFAYANGSSNTSVLKQNIALAPNTTYTLSLWYKAVAFVGAASANVYIGSTRYYVEFYNKNSAWNKVTLTFTTASGTLNTDQRIFFTLPTSNTSSTVTSLAIACVKLEQGDSATDWCLSPDEEKNYGMTLRDRGNYKNEATTEYVYDDFFRDYVYNESDQCYYIRVGQYTKVMGTTAITDTSVWNKMNNIPYLSVNTLLSREGMLGAFQYMNDAFKSNKCINDSSEPILYMNSDTGELRCNDIVARGTIYATDGVFSGLVRREVTTITSDNYLDYLSYMTDEAGDPISNRVEFNWDAMRSRIVLDSNLVVYDALDDLHEGTGLLDVDLFLPSFGPKEDEVSSKWKELARSLVDNYITIYNNSKITINIYSYNINGNGYSYFPVAPKRGLRMQCVATTEGVGSDNYEVVKWVIDEGSNANRGFVIY